MPTVTPELAQKFSSYFTNKLYSQVAEGTENWTIGVDQIKLAEQLLPGMQYSLFVPISIRHQQNQQFSNTTRTNDCNYYKYYITNLLIIQHVQLDDFIKYIKENHSQLVDDQSELNLESLIAIFTKAEQANEQFAGEVFEGLNQEEDTQLQIEEEKKQSLYSYAKELISKFLCEYYVYISKLLYGEGYNQNVIHTQNSDESDSLYQFTQNSDESDSFAGDSSYYSKFC